MSLVGALNIGKSALATHQAAIQVTGNNIANAGNADYTRQVPVVSTNPDQPTRYGVFMGTGINLSAVQRQIDEALQGRLRGSLSDSNAADVTQQWLGRVEAVFNELGEQDLSTRLSVFFNSWSDLANKPQDTGLRQIVIQNGQSVASWTTDMRAQLDGLLTSLDQRLAGQASEANRLAQQVADLNAQIVVAEGAGGTQANGLRDLRDSVLKQLSQYMDIKTVEDGGLVNVYVGSEPLVAGTISRGVSLKQEPAGDGFKTTVVFTATNGTIQATSGQLAALASARTQIETVIDQLDALAGNLIFELNKLHSSGQGLEGLSSVTASNPADDVAVALNDAKANLPFVPVNGSFVVHVRDKTSGLISSTLIKIDLDGLNGDDITLESLKDNLDAIDNISATISAGQLRITADSGNVEFSFSQDSSGVLAALGINSFFTGKDARDIAVSGEVKARPTLLAAARNGQSGDNQTARAIAALESQALTSLNGASLKSAYESMVSEVAVAAAGARTGAEAARVVHETLLAQREALSGVSLDEEAINLIRHQRAFQGAARLVSAIDELMKTILNMV